MNIYMILSEAEKAADRQDVKALRKARKQALDITARSFGSQYRRALTVKRHIDGLLIDCGV